MSGYVCSSSEHELVCTKSSFANSPCALCVAAMPKDGPRISGGRPRYQIGDMVRVNCTSARSKPAATLQWFINSELVRALVLGSHTSSLN